jgi:hypothetical protein
MMNCYSSQVNSGSHMEGHHSIGSTLNCANRWTHAIQTLSVIVKKLM